MAFRLLEMLNSARKSEQEVPVVATTQVTEEVTPTESNETEATTTAIELVEDEEKKKNKYPKVFKKYPGIYDAVVEEVSDDKQSMIISYKLRKDGEETATHRLVLSVENCNPKTLIALIRSGDGAKPTITFGEAIFQHGEGKTTGVISSDFDFLAFSHSLRSGN